MTFATSAIVHRRVALSCKLEDFYFLTVGREAAHLAAVYSPTGNTDKSETEAKK